MITDNNLRISTDQSIAINATTALSDKSVDLGVARDIGSGKNLFMNFAITTAMSAGTSCAFEIIVADDAALTSNVVSLCTTGAIARATLVAGYNTALRIPTQATTGKRYLGARYTVAGDNSAGTGKVTADIVEAVQDVKKYYASGFSVA